MFLLALCSQKGPCAFEQQQRTVKARKYESTTPEFENSGEEFPLIVAGLRMVAATQWALGSKLRCYLGKKCELKNIDHYTAQAAEKVAEELGSLAAGEITPLEKTVWGVGYSLLPETAAESSSSPASSAEKKQSADSLLEKVARNPGACEWKTVDKPSGVNQMECTYTEGTPDTVSCKVNTQDLVAGEPNYCRERDNTSSSAEQQQQQQNSSNAPQKKSAQQLAAEKGKAIAKTLAGTDSKLAENIELNLEAFRRMQLGAQRIGGYVTLLESCGENTRLIRDDKLPPVPPATNPTPCSATCPPPENAAAGTKCCPTLFKVLPYNTEKLDFGILN